MKRYFSLEDLSALPISTINSFSFIMKTKLRIPLIVCCLMLFANATFAETSPPSAVVHVDTDNSWATMGRLYVILATNDSDESYGKTAKNNSDAMEQLFQTHVADKAVTVLKIPPQHLNRQTVLSLIANLPLRAEDAVVFYYSGKGNIDRKYGQYFELPAVKDELYRSEVRSAIKDKNPRLCVLISDFCDPISAEPNQNEPGEDKQSEDKPKTNVSETAPLFFELFFVNQGIVDMSSSESGQVSCANENGIGYFTDTFAGLLAVNSHKVLSWRRVFPYVQAETSLAFERSFPSGTDIGEGRKQNIQTPVLLQFGNNVVDSPTLARIYPPNAVPDVDATATTDEERGEADRKAVTQLVQLAVGELRPFSVADRGTHENYKALDVDNTFLGRDGEPFVTRMPPVEVASVENNDDGKETENGSNGLSSADSSGPSQPVRLGIQAADNRGDGVIVTRVLDNHPGQKAGLTVGTVILRINDRRITSKQDYSDAIDAATDRLVIVVRHPGVGIPVTVTITNLENVPAK